MIKVSLYYCFDESHLLAAFISILDSVQTERVELRVKQERGYVIKEYFQPTPRGVEIAEYCLLVLFL